MGGAGTDTQTIATATATAAAGQPATTAATPATGQPATTAATAAAAAHWTDSPHAVQTGYEAGLSSRELDRGIVGYGDAARLRRVVGKLLAGQVRGVGCGANARAAAPGWM
jgi:hypothetical protein